MNELQELQKKIARITAPARELMETLDKVVPPYVREAQKAAKLIDQRLQEIAKTYRPLLTEANEAIRKAAEAARQWQVARKEDVTLMAEHGWYPNERTFFYSPEKEPSSLDELMEMQLTDDWEYITQSILSNFPNRVHILKTAFELHDSGNYIAAIPLFLSQADGICCESLKSFLFTGDKTGERVKGLVESGQIEVNLFTDVFLEPFVLKNHHNAGISKSSAAAKLKAPNRNGILHGHRKHLDYGTRTNSLKCLSLLSFVAYVTKELIPET